MKVLFLEGSPVIEQDVALRLKHVLRGLLQKEDHIIAYFQSSCSTWMELCEWSLMEFQAAHSSKQVERVGLISAEHKDRYSFASLRYERTEWPGSEQTDWRRRWAEEQADLVILYLEPLLCDDAALLRTYRMLQFRHPGKCVNLCFDTEHTLALQKFSELPWWERRAIEGCLYGEPKKHVAQELSISTSTLHNYEVSARRRLAQALLPKDRHTHRCAVFGVWQMHFSEAEKAALGSAVEYLIRCCSVTEFLIPAKAYEYMPGLRQISYICRQYAGIQVKRMAPLISPESSECAEDNSICYLQRAKRPGAKMAEEKRAMVELADVVLCGASGFFRDGLSYAKKKRTPVIQLSGDFW